MKTQNRYAALCILVLAVVVANAHAMPIKKVEPQPPAVYEEVSATMLQKALEVNDVEDVSIEEGSIGPVVKFSKYGVSMAVVSVNDKHSTIQFQTWWHIEGAPLLMKAINEWNADTTLVKAHLDANGDPWLTMELESKGGITEARLADAVDTFLVANRLFFDFLGETAVNGLAGGCAQPEEAGLGI